MCNQVELKSQIDAKWPTLGDTDFRTDTVKRMLLTLSDPKLANSDKQRQAILLVCNPKGYDVVDLEHPMHVLKALCKIHGVPVRNSVEGCKESLVKVTSSSNGNIILKLPTFGAKEMMRQCLIFADADNEKVVGSIGRAMTRQELDTKTNSSAGSKLLKDRYYPLFKQFIDKNVTPRNEQFDCRGKCK